MPCSRGCCADQRAHYRSVNAAPRFNEVGRGHQRDVALEYDRAAYKMLRRQGLQPPKLEGSYDLARRATSEAEVRLGQVIDERDAKWKKKGTRLMEDMLDVADNCMTGVKPEKGTGKKRKAMRP